MAQGIDLELKDIVLSNSSFGPNEIDYVSRRISDDFTQFPILRDLTNELENETMRTPATSVRLGVCQYLLGRYAAAIETLQNADGGALALFYQGKSNASLNNHREAVECYEKAKTAGYDADRCGLSIAQEKRQLRDIEGAMSILDNMLSLIHI